MLSLYEILKASKTGVAPDMWTALAGKNWGGADSGAEVKELTGIPPLSFTADGTPLLDFLISGNMSQTGTPTPTTPIQPQETGNRTENLFDKTTLENGIYLAVNGNKYGDITNGVRAGVKIKALPNTAYTLSAQSSATVSTRIFEWGNGTFIKQTPKYNVSGNISLTVTTDAETTEIAFIIEGVNAQYATSIMLNTGSTPLPYQPYGYKLDIKSANTTTPVYLGGVETTRKIKKYEFTGQETPTAVLIITETNAFQFLNETVGYKRERYICSHMPVDNSSTSSITHGYIGQRLTLCFDKAMGLDTVDKIKSYLAAQYANGTPVTIWYVLATPTTGTLNEPLRKIGNYADTVSMEQAGVSIPTNNGNTTVDVETTLKPSEMYIKYQE